MADTTRPPGRPARAIRGKRARGSRWQGLALWQKIGAIAVAGVLAVVLVGGVAFAGMYAAVKVPDPNADFQTNTTYLYYNDGSTQLSDLAVQNRTSLAVDEIPQPMKDAVVAAEDRTFYDNPGISPLGMTRALVAIVTGGDVQGGSTITQQYIKLMYLTPERTVTRKVNEIILALKLSNRESKDQILAMYLNRVFFGSNAYGVKTASSRYFNKAARDVNLGEAAMLAGLLKAPSSLSPARYPQAA